jgi:hypothetical protein
VLPLTCVRDVSVSSPFLSWYTVVLWMVMSAVISNDVLCVSILSFDFRIVPTLWYFCDFSFFYDFCNLYKKFKIIAYVLPLPCVRDVSVASYMC